MPLIRFDAEPTWQRGLPETMWRRRWGAITRASSRGTFGSVRRKDMHRLLRDLYGHQAWTDAEHYRAIEAHPPARDDRAIRERLHHIHLVQRAFLWAVTGQTTAFVF